MIQLINKYLRKYKRISIKKYINCYYRNYYWEKKNPAHAGLIVQPFGVVISIFLSLQIGR